MAKTLDAMDRELAAFDPGRGDFEILADALRRRGELVDQLAQTAADSPSLELRATLQCAIEAGAALTGKLAAERQLLSGKLRRLNQYVSHE